MTYEDLNWIHPDLMSWRIECEERGREDHCEYWFFYKDEDSPPISSLQLSVDPAVIRYRFININTPKGRNWSWDKTVYGLQVSCGYRKFTDITRFDSYETFYTDIAVLEESAQHKLYCFEWDLKTGKKNPTEYLFNKNETLRTIAKRYV